MIASLPMYSTPQNAEAEARFWADIRDNLRHAGIPAPDRLDKDIDDLLTHWLSPDLVISQTCGLPYRTKLRKHVSIIGTPDYCVAGCPPGYYRSVIVARAADERDSIDAFRKACFAMNDPLSQSGWAAIAFDMPWIVQNPTLVTGSHRASMQAVMKGNADFASIDAVTFRSFAGSEDATGLRVIYQTKPSPGLPLITAKSQDADVILDCVQQALAALSPADRDMLGFKSIISLPAGAYDLPIPPAPHANAV